MFVLLLVILFDVFLQEHGFLYGLFGGEDDKYSNYQLLEPEPIDVVVEDDDLGADNPNCGFTDNSDAIYVSVEDDPERAEASYRSDGTKEKGGSI